MARVLIGGETFEVAPFRLRELRLAAPHIDRVTARAAAGTFAGAEAVAEVAYDMLCVVAVGIEGASADELERRASLAEIAALREAFDRILVEAGLTRGTDAPGEGEPAARPADLSRSASTT